MWETTEKCGRQLKNVGDNWRMWKITGECGRQLKNVGDARYRNDDVCGLEWEEQAKLNMKSKRSKMDTMKGRGETQTLTDIVR